MTWGMVAQIIPGAELASRKRQDYESIIIAEGVDGEVGYGQITTRESTASLDTLSAEGNLRLS